jgi:hypothetical protein
MAGEKLQPTARRVVTSMRQHDAVFLPAAHEMRGRGIILGKPSIHSIPTPKGEVTITPVPAGTQAVTIDAADETTLRDFEIRLSHKRREWLTYTGVAESATSWVSEQSLVPGGGITGRGIFRSKSGREFIVQTDPQILRVTSSVGDIHETWIIGFGEENHQHSLVYLQNNESEPDSINFGIYSEVPRDLQYEPNTDVFPPTVAMLRELKTSQRIS